MIVFDASALLSPALKVDSVPERALLRAEQTKTFAQSVAVTAEIRGVMERPKFAQTISAARRAYILAIIRRHAVWFTPTIKITDCRDAKDNKYLELALAAEANFIVTGDNDLLVLHPWDGIRILRPAEYLADGQSRS